MARRRDRIDFDDAPVYCECGAWPAPHQTEHRSIRLCSRCFNARKGQEGVSSVRVEKASGGA